MPTPANVKHTFMKCKLCSKLINNMDLTAHANMHRQQGDIKDKTGTPTSTSRPASIPKSSKVVETMPDATPEGSAASTSTVAPSSKAASSSPVTPSYTTPTAPSAIAAAAVPSSTNVSVASQSTVSLETQLETSTNRNVEEYKDVSHLFVADVIADITSSDQLSLSCQLCKSSKSQSLSLDSYSQHLSLPGHMRNVFIWLLNTEAATVSKYQTLVQKIKNSKRTEGLFCEFCRKASFNVNDMKSHKSHLVSEKHRSIVQNVKRTYATLQRKLVKDMKENKKVLPVSDSKQPDEFNKKHGDGEELDAEKRSNDKLKDTTKKLGVDSPHKRGDKEEAKACLSNTTEEMSNTTEEMSNATEEMSNTTEGKKRKSSTDGASVTKSSVKISPRSSHPANSKRSPSWSPIRTTKSPTPPIPSSTEPDADADVTDIDIDIDIVTDISSPTSAASKLEADPGKSSNHKEHSPPDPFNSQLASQSSTSKYPSSNASAILTENKHSRLTHRRRPRRSRSISRNNSPGRFIPWPISPVENRRNSRSPMSRGPLPGGSRSQSRPSRSPPRSTDRVMRRSRSSSVGRKRHSHRSRRSPGPAMRRSQSPNRRRSPGTSRRRSRSPARRRSPSPSRRRSPGTNRRRSTSLKGQRSSSPNRRPSHGIRRRSRSNSSSRWHRSRSPNDRRGYNRGRGSNDGHWGSRHTGSTSSNARRRSSSPLGWGQKNHSRLRPRPLSPWSIDSLTFLVEKKWTAFYEKYYCTGAMRDDILCMMLQREYLQAYKGFFIEDPHFDQSYSILMKPEALRTSLTERIDRGSPGPATERRIMNTPPVTAYDTIEPGELIDDERRKELRKLKYQQQLSEMAPAAVPNQIAAENNYPNSLSTLPVALPSVVSAASSSSLADNASAVAATSSESFHSFNKLKVLIREKLKIQTTESSPTPVINTSIEVPELVKEALEQINPTKPKPEEFEFPLSASSTGKLVFSDPFLGFVHNVLSGILKMTGLQDDVDSGGAAPHTRTELHLEQRRMHESMVTPEGHLLIRMARMTLTNLPRLDSKFGKSHSDVVNILKNLDRDVLQLIADTPMLKQ